MGIISIIKRRLGHFQEYARTMNVSVFFVLWDYCMARLLHGFTVGDYLEIGDGVRMSRYERKRFLTFKKTMKVFRKVNAPDYAHKLENKVEALKLFHKYVKRSWIYPREVTFEKYAAFAREACGVNGGGNR